MSTLTDQNAAIAARCAELGLSRPQAQALADTGPFPSTVEQVLGLITSLASAGFGWRRKRRV
jgi:LPXTG-motif cell wall-anchored protein